MVGKKILFYTMPYTLMFIREPVSVNSSAKHTVYEAELLELLKNKYQLAKGKKTLIPKGEALYVQMFYFCKRRCGRDIDNILKYTIDSFRKYLYKDDSQISYVLSQAIVLEDNKVVPIDTNGMDDEALLTLTDFMFTDQRDWTSCTYFECGRKNEKFHHFNLEDLWK